MKPSPKTIKQLRQMGQTPFIAIAMETPTMNYDKLSDETIDAIRGLFRILPDHVADEVAQYVNELWPDDAEEITDRTLNNVAGVSVEQPEFASMSRSRTPVTPLTKAEARRLNNSIAKERPHMFKR